MSKIRLVILSDLWGKQNNDWLQFYTERLSDHFVCVYYDVVELAGIETQDMSENEIHQSFVEGGNDIAVQEISKLENKKSIFLCFSIGGTIAWKAALNGLPIVKLIAVSSTRLRKEYQKPRCEIQLHFGDQDLYRPMDEWFEQLELNPEIHFGKTHELYKEESIAEQICSELTTNIYF